MCAKASWMRASFSNILIVSAKSRKETDKKFTSETSLSLSCSFSSRHRHIFAKKKEKRSRLCRDVSRQPSFPSWFLKKKKKMNNNTDTPAWPCIIGWESTHENNGRFWQFPFHFCPFVLTAPSRIFFSFSLSLRSCILCVCMTCRSLDTSCPPERKRGFFFFFLCGKRWVYNDLVYTGIPFSSMRFLFQVITSTHANLSLPMLCRTLNWLNPNHNTPHGLYYYYYYRKNDAFK